MPSTPNAAPRPSAPRGSSNRLGHGVEPSHPTALEEASVSDLFATLVTADAAHQIEKLSEIARPAPRRRASSRPTPRPSCELGRGVTGAAYIGARDALDAWSRRMARFWDEGFDLLLTPTLAAPPPLLGTLSSAAASPAEVLERVRLFVAFTSPFNTTGQPAISLPLHWSADGLPIGVQLVAPRYREDLLLRVAAQLERAAPWQDRLPALAL